jgi:hypothetical protein
MTEDLTTELAEAGREWAKREEAALGLLLRAGPMRLADERPGEGRLCMNDGGLCALATLHRLERSLDVIKTGTLRPSFVLTPKGRERAEAAKRRQWFERRLAATSPRPNS